MITSIRKSVQRITHEDVVREKGKDRKIVVRLGPGDIVQFRLHGRRKTSFTDGLSVKELFWIALKRTVTRDWTTKNNNRKAMGKRPLKQPIILN